VAFISPFYDTVHFGIIIFPIATISLKVKKNRSHFIQDPNSRYQNEPGEKHGTPI
jgi:hypothetical protein